MAHWNQQPDRQKKSKEKFKKHNKALSNYQEPVATGVAAGIVTKAPTEYKSQYYGGTTYGQFNYKNGGGYVKVPTPEDTKDVTKLSIVLMRQSTLNAISAICQPVAGASEFQVHYRSLITRIKSPSNELIISIPTVFYNFKQKVAHASVDYHLDDIDNAADVVKPISDSVIKEIFKEMPILAAIKEMYEGVAEVTFSEVNSGSIHRHPGRFGFSGTDYTKTPSHPGVIYREAEATDKVHTDSVIYLGDRTEIYTTETRILNIAPKDNGVEGTYCQLPTSTYLLNDIGTPEEQANSMAELLGGLENSIKDVSGDYYVTNSMGAVNGYALVTEIISAFKDTTFEQDISNVLASHITSNSYTTGVVHYGGAVKKHSQSYQEYLGYDDYDDWDYGYGSWDRSAKSSTAKTPKVTSESIKTIKDNNPYITGTPDWYNWNKRNDV